MRSLHVDLFVKLQIRIQILDKFLLVNGTYNMTYAYTHIYKFIIIAAFANLLLLSIIFKTNIYNCEFFRKICTKIYKMEKLIGKFNKY